MTTTSHHETLTPARPGRAPVFAAAAGTVIEGYDFALYGAFAALLAPTIFFPGGNPTVALLAGVSTFVVGNVARPAGALLFGHIGDRVGRRSALLGTLSLMGFGTLLIGVLPSYAAVGVAAPVLLVAARLLQGIALGGEWGGGTLLAVEGAGPESGRERRGARGAVVPAGIAAGSAMASVTLLVVTQLPETDLLSWGWRVPFLLGALLAVAGIAIRWWVAESPDHQALRAHGEIARAPVVEALRSHGRTIALVVLSYVGGSSVFYGLVVFGQSYGVALGLPRGQVASLLGISSVSTVALALAAGALSDRIGHRRTVLISLCACAVAAPVWLMLYSTGTFGAAALAYLLLGCAIGLNFGVLGVLYVRCFPVQVRYSGASIGYSLGTVLGGLTTIASTVLFVATGTAWWAVGYVIVLLVVSFAATAALRPLDDKNSA